MSWIWLYIFACFFPAEYVLTEFYDLRIEALFFIVDKVCILSRFNKCFTDSPPPLLPSWLFEIHSSKE